MFNSNIICPNCNTENDCSGMTREERMVLHCGVCDTEIGELVPKIFYIKELIYFIINALIFSLIIGVSAYAFENYNAWKSISGFIFFSSILLASIALHEFFHAFCAFIFGDYTILDEGYLRLNFFKYYNSLNSLIFPMIIFVFTGIFLPGAAVYIQMENIKYRIFKFIVNISGIFSQIIFLNCILLVLNSSNLILSNEMIAILHFSAYIQLLLLLYNLLPIPGIDGWHAISALIFPKIGNILSKYFSMQRCRQFCMHV